MGSIFILFIINYQTGLIAVYYDGTSVPLLNENFDKLLPLINVCTIFGAGIAVVHVIKRRKTFITTSLQFLQTIFSGIIMILLAKGDIFNEIVIEGYDLEIIPKLFVIGMIIGAIATFIGVFVSYAKVIIERSGSEKYIKDTINKFDKH